MHNKLINLDCTLRDGGYYNDWNFSVSLINKYLSSMSKAGIKYIEIGYRNNNNNNLKRGNCFYCNDKFLEKLNIPPNMNLGVMVNVEDFYFNGKVNLKLINHLFPNRIKSKLNFVRIAFKTKQIDAAIQISKKLKKLNYFVCLNLMQISLYQKNEIDIVLKKISTKFIDVFYIVDSFGNLTPENLKNIIQNIKKLWTGVLGFHGHDNLRLASVNSKISVSNGVSFIDSTILGMGRGAGNLITEEFLIEQRNDGINIEPLVNLSVTKFKILKDKYKWGTNSFYYYSALKSIHPSYVYYLTEKEKYKPTEIFNILFELSKLDTTNFNINLVNSLENFYKSKVLGKNKVSEFINKKNILLIGGGASTKKYKKNIEEFIMKKSPLVIMTNNNKNIDTKYVNFRIICHPMRILADHKFYQENNIPIITPFSMLKKDISELINTNLLFDYGLKILPRTLRSKTYYCEVPYINVLAYFFGIIMQVKDIESIIMVGFDGYKNDLERNGIINLKIYSATPTMYELDNININNYGK